MKDSKLKLRNLNEANRIRKVREGFPFIFEFPCF